MVTDRTHKHQQTSTYNSKFKIYSFLSVILYGEIKRDFDKSKFFVDVNKFIFKYKLDVILFLCQYSIQ